MLRKHATPTRISIAEGLKKTQQNVPAAAATVEVLAETLLLMRARHKDNFEAGGLSLSYFSMISWAVAEGIKQYPIFQCRWTEEIAGDKKKYFIDEFPSINIGIAMGLERGLKIPVLYNSESKTFPEFAKSLQELIARISAGKSTAEDMALDKATFTVNNYGASRAIDWGIPLLPYGHAGILGIGTIRRRPIGIYGAPHTVFLTLVFDHRLQDGEPFANNFLGYLKRYIENFPENILQI